MMQCLSCGAESPATARFCSQCAAPLVRALTCPGCGSENGPGSRFCSQCAHALQSPEAAPPATLAPVANAFVQGRYQVTKLLGEGGKKRVYQATDTRLGREVAFALIKIDGLDAAGRERLRREAQAMARLGDHPHIVTVHDMGEEQGQPYLVSQLMSGGDLASLVASAPDHRLPLEQILALGGQICQALVHAHAHQIIHRDLKPGNIWLTADGVAKLGDFGLAVALDQSRHTQPGMMVGTVSYMAPEQAIGGNVDARADLYALGCVLYELVCGRPPFVGDESVAIITQHLNTPPVGPSWHRPDCPPGLEALILRLLEKDPGRRPGSATEVGATLGGIGTALASYAEPAGEGGADLIDGTRSEGQRANGSAPEALYRNTFIGRESELRQLQATYDAALGGHGGLVMVVGEPGIGKTSLCEQLSTYVTVRGGRTIVGHSYEEGSLSLPYLPFVEALRSYTLSQEPEALREVMGSAAADLARIVSEVQERVAVAPRAPSGDPDEDRWRLFEAVSSFLRSAASLQPIVLILEDLHWADRGTLDLLQHLARQLGGARLLVIGTYRDVEVDRSHPLSSALADLRRSGAYTRLGLRGLSVDEVHRMMQEIRGQDVPWSRAEAIHRQTEGNPLFVQEVLRFIVEEGLLVREHGRWVRTDDGDPDAGIPEGLRDVIGKRLSRLSAEANQVLTVAAVIGREFRLDVLRHVVQRSEDEVVEALEEAQARAIIEERRVAGAGGLAFRFTHAFFRQTLYEEIFAARRIRWHQQVGRALELVYARRLDEHAAELGEHFANSSDADDLVKAVHYSELAARRAMAIYAYGEAVRHLERALEAQEVLDPDDAARHCDLLLALGEAMMPTEHLENVPAHVAEPAFQLSRAMHDDARSASAAVMALEAMAHHAPHPGTYRSREFQEWSRRADQYASPGTALRVYAHIHAGMARLFVEGPAPAHARLQDALHEAEALGSPRELYLAAGWAFRHLLAPRNFPLLDLLANSMEGRSRDGAAPVDLSILLRHLGSWRLGHGDRASAERLWSELTEIGRKTHDITVQALAQQPGCILKFLEGDLEGAAGNAEALRGQAEGGYLRSTWTRSLLYLGVRTDEVIEALAYGGDSRPFLANRASVLANLGHVQEALAIMDRFQGLDAPDDESAAVVLLHLLEAAIRCGDRNRAELLYSRLLPIQHVTLVGESNFTCVRRILGHCDRMLGRVGQAHEHYLRAIEQCAAIGFRPELALLHLDLAELLLAHEPDSRSRAMELLDLAIAEFRRMGMQPALEQAIRRKLQAQGVDSATPSTSIDAVLLTVQNERPRVHPQAAPGETVTLLFTDIQDSTTLTLSLGDQRWLKVLRSHHALVREHVARNGGFEVKCQGDGFMLAFQSAAAALTCAVAIQRSLIQQPGERDILVRMGLHTGEILRDADDFHGRHVVLAARIADQAQGGEILASPAVREAAGTQEEVHFDPGHAVLLKGWDEPQLVHRVLWEQSE